MIGYIVGYGYLFFLILVLGGLFTHFQVKQEYSRKILHTLIGLTWLVLHFFFRESWQILVMPLSFVLINYLSYKFRWFSAIERKEDNHMGTVYYALSMTLLMCFAYLFPETENATGVAVFALSFGDGMSALVGTAVKKHNPQLIGKKTLFGFVACAAGSIFGVALLSLIIGLKVTFPNLLLIGLGCALLELIGGEFDNFSITYGVYILCLLTGTGTALSASDNTVLLAWALVLPTGIAIATVIKKALSVKGALMSWAVMFLSLFFGGWTCFSVLVFSFAVITVVDHAVKGKTPPEISGIHKRTGARGGIQVFVNGFAAVASAIFCFYTKDTAFQTLYFIAVAESLADSMASDIGVLSKGKTVDICRLKAVDKGISGGVSALGCGFAVIGSFTVAAFSVPFLGIGVKTLFIAFLPLVGVLSDSILGSLVQVRYRCTVCEKRTEKKVHCEKATRFEKGIPFIDNDAVNLLSNVATVLLGYLLLRFAV